MATKKISALDAQVTPLATDLALIVHDPGGTPVSEKTTLDNLSKAINYTNLANKPTLGTASALDVPASGDAGSTEVVKGNDTRLTNARTPASHNNDQHSTAYIAEVVNDTTPQLGGDLDFNSKFLLHNSILSTNGVAQGTVIKVTVDTNANGFSSVLGQSADFHYDDADADATPFLPLVMAVDAGTGDSKRVLVEGQVCNSAWSWSAGLIYLSTTAGVLTQTAPSATNDYVQVVGWALSSQTIYFKPSLVVIKHA